MVPRLPIYLRQGRSVKYEVYSVSVYETRYTSKLITTVSNKSNPPWAGRYLLLVGDLLILNDGNFVLSRYLLLVGDLLILNDGNIVLSHHAL